MVIFMGFVLLLVILALKPRVSSTQGVLTLQAPWSHVWPVSSRWEGQLDAEGSAPR